MPCRVLCRPTRALGRDAILTFPAPGSAGRHAAGGASDAFLDRGTGRPYRRQLSVPPQFSGQGARSRRRMGCRPARMGVRRRRAGPGKGAVPRNLRRGRAGKRQRRVGPVPERPGARQEQQSVRRRGRPAALLRPPRSAARADDGGRSRDPSRLRIARNAIVRRLSARRCEAAGQDLAGETRRLWRSDEPPIPTRWQKPASTSPASPRSKPGARRRYG